MTMMINTKKCRVALMMMMIMLISSCFLFCADAHHVRKILQDDSGDANTDELVGPLLGGENGAGGENSGLLGGGNGGLLGRNGGLLGGLLGPNGLLGGLLGGNGGQG